MTDDEARKIAHQLAMEQQEQAEIARSANVEYHQHIARLANHYMLRKMLGGLGTTLWICGGAFVALTLEPVAFRIPIIGPFMALTLLLGLLGFLLFFRRIWRFVARKLHIPFRLSAPTQASGTKTETALQPGAPDAGDAGFANLFGDGTPQKTKKGKTRR